MIDIHSHILYGIDDGAQNLDESLALVREAIENGITQIIATPHHKNGLYTSEKDKVFDLVSSLQAAIDEQQLSLTILPGQEIRTYGGLLADLQGEDLLTLNNEYKHILLELPHDHVPHYLSQQIYELQLANVTPIIPHPERNKSIVGNPKQLYQFVKKGALVQLTAASVIGRFGRVAQQFCFDCLEHDLCHFIASDAHQAGKRGFLLAEAYDVIAERYGQHLVDQLQENAQRIVQGQEIYVEPPLKIEEKKSLLQRLVGGRRKR